jgi:hypothetical protein
MLILNLYREKKELICKKECKSNKKLFTDKFFIHFLSNWCCVTLISLLKKALLNFGTPH